MRQFKWARIDTRYRMDKEDWLYIGYLLMASIIAFGVGLTAGWLWSLAI